jgi:hypothetical protein
MLSDPVQKFVAQQPLGGAMDGVAQGAEAADTRSLQVVMGSGRRLRNAAIRRSVRHLTQ